MKKIVSSLVCLLVICFAMAGCSSGEEPSVSSEPITINVLAAASMQDALEEIQVEFEKENNITAVFQFAASGTLQKQIEEGAPCDFFVSASKKHMDALAEKDLIDEESRTDLLVNKLTLIASAEYKDIIKTSQDITKPEVKHMAIGTPESVPAGTYAKEALETLGLWGDMENKMVFGKDVRQVLTYVDNGEAECGLVYASDALLLESGVVVCDMPQDSHSPIVYPAAIMKESKNKEAAATYYDYLKADKAKKIFEKYGFTI